jgi:hypothetical protein
VGCYGVRDVGPAVLYEHDALMDEDEMFDQHLARQSIGFSPSAPQSWVEKVGMRQHEHGPWGNTAHTMFCRGCGEQMTSNFKPGTSSGVGEWWAGQLVTHTSR